MATDFPTKGDDKKVNLRNSNYPQFDYDFAAGVKENNKESGEPAATFAAMKRSTFGQSARDGEETRHIGLDKRSAKHGRRVTLRMGRSSKMVTWSQTNQTSAA